MLIVDDTGCPALSQTTEVQCGEPELVQQSGHGRLRVGVVARVEDRLVAFLVLGVRGDERGKQGVERLHDPRSGKALGHPFAAREVTDVAPAPPGVGRDFQTEYSILPPEAASGATGPGVGITLGPIAIHCAILRPCKNAHLASGPTEVSGFAFAGDDRTVARVDVSTDGGGTWTHADLDPPENPWTWQHWHATLTLPPGEAEIIARAWDSTAAMQAESPATVWNPIPGDTPTMPQLTCTSHAIPDQMLRQNDRAPLPLGHRSGRATPITEQRDNGPPTGSRSPP
ncbi:MULTISPECIES: hypothetical protein [unclassified Streptomyces]|uniref:hypothetical protein n=1 Tax=unclassified Streptomyces TaxID=2593676 RepID=UPI003D80AB05